MSYKADLYIDAGTTFSTDIELTDENGDAIQLSNYTANSIFKKWYTSSLFTAFVCSINANSGIVTLSLAANTTQSLEPGRYVYDVNLFQNGSTNVIRIVEGTVTIRPAVTDGVYNSNNTDSY